MGDRFVNPAYPLFSYQCDESKSFVSNGSDKNPLPENTSASEIYNKYFGKESKSKTKK
ncbi:MAG: hypothetical protein MJ213_01335 [Bacilli bacterium]|nr:hypothetical protein [Bacilli bacterium]